MIQNDIKYIGWRFSSFSVILLFIAFIITGISFIPLLNIQLKPSRTLPSLEITYYWYGASPRVIEKEVTSKLESALSRISSLKNISSQSSKNYGRINLEFKKNVDIDLIRFEVASVIRQVYTQLPQGVSYPEISIGIKGEKKEVLLVYNIISPASPSFIQKYADENIFHKISKIKGVGDVVVYGANPLEYIVTLDVKKLINLNITSYDVINAIVNFFSDKKLGLTNNINSMGDTIYTNVVLSTKKDSNSFNYIPVKNIKNRTIYLHEIASIKLKEKTPYQYYRINGLNTINLVIYSKTGSNTLKTARLVKNVINQIKPVLPPNYDIILSYDSTDYTVKELKTISLRTVFSVLFLSIFVLFVNRSFRYLIIILISLFANLFIAAIFYYIFKVEIHLYSLAGITVSFGLIIDNSIVMIDHLRYYKNKKVFLAILAATLTTIGSIGVIFFLKESQRINVIDFAIVVLINLIISMFIALFLIPALVDKIKINKKITPLFYKRKRRIVKFSRNYYRFLMFSKKWKLIYFILFILAFGIPVHLLPQKIEKENRLASIYNATIGSETFGKIRPIIEKIFGGTFRLFSQNVFESSFYTEPERTKLYINGSMPEGCTVQQLNEAMLKMENYLKGFNEIEMFKTSIFDYNYGSIEITFKRVFETGYFPYFLKELVTSFAINLGGVDWSIYGVGEGFSNALYSGFKSNRIIVEGYNYDRLFEYSRQLCDSLTTNPRIRDIEISGNISWRTESNNEFILSFDKFTMAKENISLYDYYFALRNLLYSGNTAQIIVNNQKYDVIVITSETDNFDIWKFKNEPVIVKESVMPFSRLSTIEKRKTEHDIYKNNQLYRLIVAYDFIGPYNLAERVMSKYIKIFENILPVGYKIYSERYSFWYKEEKKQYLLIFLVILIIYFICCILFESLSQPLAIIMLIPVSFIGLFLTFVIFKVNFDQGGFAAFIMLSGLTVNSGLYILNDYNNLLKNQNKANLIKLYIKAYNSKIIPTLLTILSTIIGLLPFILGKKEIFWYSFATGTIGGLIFSVVGIFFLFPLFLKASEYTKKQ